MNSRQLRNLISLLVVILVAVVGYFQSRQGGGGGGRTDACQDEFRAGQPTSSVAGVRVLCRVEYVSLYDPARKVPLVVGEYLRPDEFQGDVERNDAFQPDPELPAGQRAELSDYQGSGLDRGHMAPAADFSSSETSMTESFYLSNMVPQNSTLNRGLWASLEAAARSCARQQNGVYVLTGPVFQGRTRAIGPDKVAVPSSVYKIVVSGNEARAWLVPNKAVSRSGLSRYATTVDQLQQLSGLTFFPQGGVTTSAQGTFCAQAFGS
ncbi:DNA/RNA non-specific endonuclease [Deinococcus sonorensis]|uniref:Endonuclease n=2 Tax=Deinococcus sonorensis TaxID=309891 RepID=A0AAU7UAR0_9DEIO